MCSKMKEFVQVLKSLCATCTLQVQCAAGFHGKPKAKPCLDESEYDAYLQVSPELGQGKDRKYH